MAVAVAVPAAAACVLFSYLCRVFLIFLLWLKKSVQPSAVVSAWHNYRPLRL